MIYYSNIKKLNNNKKFVKFVEILKNLVNISIEKNISKKICR